MITQSLKTIFFAERDFWFLWTNHGRDYLYQWSGVLQVRRCDSICSRYLALFRPGRHRVPLLCCLCTLTWSNPLYQTVTVTFNTLYWKNLGWHGGGKNVILIHPKTVADKESLQKDAVGIHFNSYHSIFSLFSPKLSDYVMYLAVLGIFE